MVNPFQNRGRVNVGDAGLLRHQLRTMPRQERDRLLRQMGYRNIDLLPSPDEEAPVLTSIGVGSPMEYTEGDTQTTPVQGTSYGTQTFPVQGKSSGVQTLPQLRIQTTTTSTDASTSPLDIIPNFINRMVGSVASSSPAVPRGPSSTPIYQQPIAPPPTPATPSFVPKATGARSRDTSYGTITLLDPVNDYEADMARIVQNVRLNMKFMKV